MGTRVPALCAGLMGIALALGGCSAAAASTAANGRSLTSTTCEDLAQEAVKISEKEDVQLLKVRVVKVATDNRKGFTKPTGDKDALALSCTGTGVWSDGRNSPVILKLTVDSDGEQFVEYQEK